MDLPPEAGEKPLKSFVILCSLTERTRCNAGHDTGRKTVVMDSECPIYHKRFGTHSFDQPGKRGLLLSYMFFNVGRRVGEMSEDQRIEFVCEQLERFLLLGKFRLHTTISGLPTIYELGVFTDNRAVFD
jgi:hypothetical protein